MTDSISTRHPIAVVSREIRLEHVELPKQIVLLQGLVGGTVLGKIMLDRFAGELDTKALQSLATTLGGALSLNGAQTSRLATAVVAWAPALMLNSPGAWAGLVKVILQALPPDVRKRMPALGEIERGLSQGEQTARERWKELQKTLPDFSAKHLTTS